MNQPKVRSLAAGHIPALDGIRGIAIALVLLVHFVGPIHSAPGHPLQDLIVKLAGYGTLGIDLFFVLSGFLITGILLKTKPGSRFFRNFYIRRTLRIFPLYYIVLIFFFIILPQIPWFQGPIIDRIGQGQIWAWTYLYNFYIASIGDWHSVPYISHFWSLAVEEQFYLVWPFCVYYLSTKNLIKLSWSLIAFATLLHMMLEIIGIGPIAIHTLTPLRLSALCGGALAATLLGEPEIVAGGRPWAMTAAWKILLASILMKILIVVISPLSPAFYAPLQAFRTLSWLGIFVSLHFAAVSAEPNSVVTRILITRPLLILGKYSYGIYIFHHFIMWGMIQYKATDWVSQYIADPFQAGLILAFFATLISILIAFISYHSFEKHFLRLKDVWAG